MTLKLIPGNSVPIIGKPKIKGFILVSGMNLIAEVSGSVYHWPMIVFIVPDQSGKNQIHVQLFVNPYFGDSSQIPAINDRHVLAPFEPTQQIIDLWTNAVASFRASQSGIVVPKVQVPPIQVK